MIYQQSGQLSMTKVGNNIKLLRQKFNLSQREFAKVIGISKSYVSDMSAILKILDHLFWNHYSGHSMWTLTGC